MTHHLETIEINPPNKATSSIIWLHGLGADGNDFVPIADELRLPTTMSVRFVFPHAPVMPITINNGYEMRAWFDIHELSIAAKIDEKGIQHAKRLLEGLIAKEESRGINAENIILAGFSQGAVIALTTGLNFPKRLGGIIALSGFLPLADKVLASANPANQATPIFIAHGTEDNMLPFALGEATAKFLENAHYPVTWHAYRMGHAVCAEEISDISEWLGKL